MSTAVLDLDLEQLPDEIPGLEQYQNAFILMRLHSRPVGVLQLQVNDGHLSGAALRDACYQLTRDWNVWQLWLNGFLQLEKWESICMTLPNATVAVCTHDRPEDLRHCLTRLMRLPDDGQELLVIDNAPSSDATLQVVKQYPRVRYVMEPHVGLNVARNRALAEAEHEIVVFTDDDAVPDYGWLRGLRSAFQDPLILCATGLTLPLELETEAQEAFERFCSFRRGFQRRVFDWSNTSPLDAGKIGAGVNMALRKNTLELVGKFDPALDAGTGTRSGGDNEMFSRILRAGYRIAYEPAALNWHRHRRTWHELHQTVYGYGLGVYAAWMRSWMEGETTAPMYASRWFFHQQLPTLLRAMLRRPNSPPLSLITSELRGCLVGPGMYLAERRRNLLSL